VKKKLTLSDYTSRKRKQVAAAGKDDGTGAVQPSPLSGMAPDGMEGSESPLLDRRGSLGDGLEGEGDEGEGAKEEDVDGKGE
jgi:hypothetical protein